MALHGIAWDPTNFDQKPTALSLVGQVAAFIMATRQAVRQRFQPEHSFDLANDDMQGAHKEGSARVWTGASRPTDPFPVYATNETTRSAGRVHVDTAEATLDVHDGSTWVQLTDAAATAKKIAVRNADGEVLTATPDAGSPATAAATKAYADALVTDLQAAIDAVADTMIPVGFVYTQLPGCDAPATLYAHYVASHSWVWTEVTSSYAGAFFRAEGGQASAFGSGVQSDEFREHTHLTDTTALLKNSDGLGAVTALRSSSGDNPTSQTVPGLAGQTEISGGAETRPRNYTVRIWQRTA